MPGQSKIHRSALGVMLTGILFSSVLMHRNSPDTHIMVTHTRFIIHLQSKSNKTCRLKTYSVTFVYPLYNY